MDPEVAGRFDAVFGRLKADARHAAECTRLMGEFIARADKILAGPAAPDEHEVTIVATKSGSGNRERRSRAQGFVAARLAKEEARRLRDDPPAVPQDKLVLNKRRLDGECVALIDRDLAERLMSHQIEGIRVIWNALVVDRAGLILADHMGLGKSAQAIVFLKLYMARFGPKRALIVAPLSVISGWEKEIKTWAGDSLAVWVISANPNHPSSASTLQNWQKSGGILLTNYEQFSINAKDNERAMLSDSTGPQVVILDEGHKIRNVDSGVYKNLSKIATPRRLILTGYPLQNNLREYWAMVDWACPGVLSSEAEYWEVYRKPVGAGLNQNSTMGEIGIARRRAWQLYDMLKPLVLRRGAFLLQESLPPKKDMVIYCAMPRIQWKIYQTIINHIQRFRDRCGFNPFVATHVLQCLAAHPVVLINHLRRKSIDQKGEFAKEMSKLLPNVMALVKESGYEEAKLGGKIGVAMALLAEFMAQKEKVLIFTRHNSTLEELYKMCQKSLGATKILRFDGETTAAAREEIVSQINNPDHPARVLLMAIRAGSEGLNLIGATRIIIFDVGWNPSYESQASCRVYRYGQTKPVAIYRLVADSTVEQVLFQCSLAKDNLLKWVVNDESTNVQRFKNIDWPALTNIPPEPESEPSFPYDVPAVPASFENDAPLQKLVEMSATFDQGVRVTRIDAYPSVNEDNINPPGDEFVTKARRELEEDREGIPLLEHRMSIEHNKRKEHETDEKYLSLYHEFEQDNDEVVFVKELYSRDISPGVEEVPPDEQAGSKESAAPQRSQSDRVKRPAESENYVEPKRYRSHETSGWDQGSDLDGGGDRATRRPTTYESDSRTERDSEPVRSSYAGSPVRKSQQLPPQSQSAPRPQVGAGRGIGLTTPAWATKAAGNGRLGGAQPPPDPVPPSRRDDGHDRSRHGTHRPTDRASQDTSRRYEYEKPPQARGWSHDREPHISRRPGRGTGDGRRDSATRGGESGHAWEKSTRDSGRRDQGSNAYRGDRERGGGRYEQGPSRGDRPERGGGRSDNSNRGGRGRGRGRGGRDAAMPDSVYRPAPGDANRVFVVDNRDNKPAILGSGRGTSLTKPAWQVKLEREKAALNGNGARH